MWGFQVRRDIMEWTIIRLTLYHVLAIKPFSGNGQVLHATVLTF